MANHLMTIDRNTYESLQQELQALRQLVVSRDEKFSQEQMGLFIEYTPAAIAIFDREMRYLLASRRWREDYGLGNQDIIGRSHDEIFPEVSESWREIHQRCLSGKIEKCAEDAFSRADGTTDWVKWEIHPWYDNSGVVGGVIMFTEVITTRKQAEAELKRLNEELAARVEERTKALQESEARCQRLLDNVPGMVYEFHLHPDGTMFFAYVSSGCRKIIGREAKELLNDASVIFADIHDEDRLNVQAAIAHSAQTLQNFEYEWRIITPSGEQKWMKAVSKPKGRVRGEVVWYGCLFDITEQQAALRDRKQVEALLQEQEHFLRSIYEGVDQIIFVVDVLENCEFRYAGWNSTSEKATGISRSEVIGKSPEALFGNTEGVAVRQRYQNCLETGIGISYEEMLTVNNQETWWLTKINPLKNSEGRIYRLVGTTLNITERKQAEIKLQQQAENLENTLRELQVTQTQLIHSEKMSSLGNMVAGVAHEINNPVNFIHGNLIPASEYAHDLLQLVLLYQIHFPYPPEEIKELLIDIDFDFLKEDLVKLLTSMRVGTQRIREIVLSLRNFSRLDEAEFKQVDIHEGIDSTLMILHNRLKVKPEHPEILVIKEYGKLPLVECYPGQLNQVFMNIISNAIDALEGSFVGEQGQIHIRTEVMNNNWISINISDNGIGIDAEIVSKLFDPFFTTKNVGKGTGLGLSISYQIVVDRHRGKLSCHSELGQGAEFVIEIPINQHENS
ncbi:PAS domain-containing sensor histidine kinase [Nostoc sp. UHCC 0870]|uniref:PAS domain-containing sensor histidine kinase n=1 Tax=Nostoc sp. UHCC 0870 TaxID=2914041 RepID=UPI001EDF597F|nr:PAS domain S-box protein [Nostoc sp. UHCC 0870]UKO97537.1 PAS domain S-box protein [Nostoc sp. UHCC 0870]